ncbi:Myb family DNA-binding domain-containing protein [Toxoplasma gondii VEG]|uniref:Myb family DNA-binding domain-containing protein n=3 Tax=Toxoplasma gondii TaxID=5811 RepID=V4Z8F6_TOXGV|nr:Myb family DNA-binding domain-containing protein [Toxoplasma gondii VEG]KFG27939.1 Myb family DNA-binding domain-containing protein [Toxoplasma gondii p89]PUA83504.1 Myb family DNA-binding domain-containing protein [Toxoplasma gondii TgCATBr9]
MEGASTQPMPHSQRERQAPVHAISGTWENCDQAGEYKGTACCVVERQVYSTETHAVEGCCSTRWNGVKEEKGGGEVSSRTALAGVVHLYTNSDGNAYTHISDQGMRQDEAVAGQEQRHLNCEGEHEKKGNVAAGGGTLMVTKSEIEPCDDYYSVQRGQSCAGERAPRDGCCRLLDGSRVDPAEGGSEEDENCYTHVLQKHLGQMPTAPYQGDDRLQTDLRLGDFQSGPSDALSGHHVTRTPILSPHGRYSEYISERLAWQYAERPGHGIAAENTVVMHSHTGEATGSLRADAPSQWSTESRLQFHVGSQFTTENPELFAGIVGLDTEQFDARNAEALHWRQQGEARSTETECIADIPPERGNRSTIRQWNKPEAARQEYHRASASARGPEETNIITRGAHSDDQSIDAAAPGCWAARHLTSRQHPNPRPRMKEEHCGREREVLSSEQPSDCGETQKTPASHSLVLDSKSRADASQTSPYTRNDEIQTIRAFEEQCLEVQLPQPRLRRGIDYEAGMSQLAPTTQELKAKVLTTGLSPSCPNAAVLRASVPLSMDTTVTVHLADVEDPSSKRHTPIENSISSGHCDPPCSSPGGMMEPRVSVSGLGSPHNCVEDREIARHGDGIGRDILERRPLPFSPAALLTGCSSTAASSVVSGDVFTSVAASARANACRSSTDTQEESGCGDAPRYVLLFPDEQDERLGHAQTSIATPSGSGQSKCMFKGDGNAEATFREEVKSSELRTPSRIQTRRLLPGVQLQGMDCDGCGASDPQKGRPAPETGFLPEICHFSPQHPWQPGSEVNQGYRAGADYGTSRVQQSLENCSWEESVDEGEQPRTTSSSSYGQDTQKRDSFLQSIDNRIASEPVDPTGTCGYNSTPETFRSGCIMRDQMLGVKPHLSHVSLTREGKHRGQQTHLRKTGVPTWSAEEDASLAELVSRKGFKWALISSQLTGAFGIPRTGKQCRERWFNHVNPEVKKGDWSAEEDAMILMLQNELGNRWATIAKKLRGRTENAVKNRFISLSNARLGYGRPKRDGSSADCFSNRRTGSGKSSGITGMPNLCQSVCSAGTTKKDSSESGNHSVMSVATKVFEFSDVAVDSGVSRTRQCTGTSPSCGHPSAGEGDPSHLKNTDVVGREQPIQRNNNESGKAAEQTAFSGVKTGTLSVSQDAVPVGRLVVASVGPQHIRRSFPTDETLPKFAAKEHNNQQLNDEREHLEQSNSTSEGSFLASAHEHADIARSDPDEDTLEPHQKRRRKRCAIAYQGEERGDSNGLDSIADRAEQAGNFQAMTTANTDNRKVDYLEPHRYEKLSPCEQVIQPSLRPACDHRGGPQNSVESGEQSPDAQRQLCNQGCRTSNRTVHSSVYSNEVESNELRGVFRLAEQSLPSQSGDPAWSTAGFQLSILPQKVEVHSRNKCDGQNVMYRCSPGSLPTTHQQTVFHYDRDSSRFPCAAKPAAASGAQGTIEENDGLVKEGPSMIVTGSSVEVVHCCSVSLRRRDRSLPSAQLWTSQETESDTNPSPNQQHESCHQYLKLDDLQKQSRGTVLSAKEEIGKPETWSHVVDNTYSKTDHQRASLCAENSSGCAEGSTELVRFSGGSVKSGSSMSVDCGSGNPDDCQDCKAEEIWRGEQRYAERGHSVESRGAGSVGRSTDLTITDSGSMPLCASPIGRPPADNDTLFLSDARCNIVAQLNHQDNSRISRLASCEEEFLACGGERLINASGGFKPDGGCLYRMQQAGACNTKLHRPVHSCSTIDSEQLEDLPSVEKAVGDRSFSSKRKGDIPPFAEWKKNDELRELYRGVSEAVSHGQPGDWNGSWPGISGRAHQTSSCFPDRVNASDRRELNSWRLHVSAAAELGSSHIWNSQSYASASVSRDKQREPPKNGLTGCDVPEYLGTSQSAGLPAANAHERGNFYGHDRCRPREGERVRWVGLQRNRKPEASVSSGASNSATTARPKDSTEPDEGNSEGVSTRRKDSGSTAATISRAVSLGMVTPSAACENSSSLTDTSPPLSHRPSFSFTHCCEETLSRCNSSNYLCPPATCHTSDDGRSLGPSREAQALRSLSLASGYGYPGIPAEATSFWQGSSLEHSIMEPQMVPSDDELRLWVHPRDAANWSQSTLKPVAVVSGTDAGDDQHKTPENLTPESGQAHRRDGHDMQRVQRCDDEGECPPTTVELTFPHSHSSDEMQDLPSKVQGNFLLRRELSDSLQHETAESVAGYGWMRIRNAGDIPNSKVRRLIQEMRMDDTTASAYKTASHLCIRGA